MQRAMKIRLALTTCLFISSRRHAIETRACDSHGRLQQYNRARCILQRYLRAECTGNRLSPGRHDDVAPRRVASRRVVGSNPIRNIHDSAYVKCQKDARFVIHSVVESRAVARIRCRVRQIVSAGLIPDLPCIKFRRDTHS